MTKQSADFTDKTPTLISTDCTDISSISVNQCQESLHLRPSASICGQDEKSAIRNFTRRSLGEGGPKSEIRNVLAAGVGGQGIIRLADILAEVAFEAGYDVKKSEIHGLAQRGGSVTSSIRWGKKIHSPVIPDGEADFIIALEELEALRNAHVLRPGGVIIINDFRLLPVTVVTGKAKYPENIDARLREYGTVERVPASEIARGLGNTRASNVVLLGVLSRHLGLPEKAWASVLSKSFPAKLLDLNLKAFEAGRELAKFD